MNPIKALSTPGEFVAMHSNVFALARELIALLGTQNKVINDINRSKNKMSAIFQIGRNTSKNIVLLIVLNCVVSKVDIVYTTRVE
jgi:hypothetical protein